MENERDDGVRQELFMIDQVQLYPSAMYSEKLPKKSFKEWSPAQCSKLFHDITHFNSHRRWNSDAAYTKIVDGKEACFGLMILCDLVIPPEVQFVTDLFPIILERRVVTRTMLGPKQKILYDRLKKSSKDAKIVGTMYPKKYSCQHYLVLPFLLDFGVQLQCIHGVVEFEQSYYMRKIISKNTDLRKSAKSSFLKQQYKLNK